MDNSTMEYRIRLEKQNKRDDQVTELILDNCRASQISGLTDEFVNLEVLSLINVGLTTLKGFPKLPKLKKLELSDNRLAGGLNLLHGSPNLQHLNISGNRIKDLEALEPLKEFRSLLSLDLYHCDVTKVEDYRKKVFELIPNLQALDGYDKNQVEVNSDDENDDDEDEEESDVDNHITRNGSNGDKNAEGIEDSDDDADDEEASDEEDYDEEDDDDDDDIDEDYDEEEDIGQNSSGEMATIARDADGDDDIQEIDDDDDDDDDGEDGDGNDDEEDEGEDDEEVDLRELQKDSIVDESDDEDFEPTHEPDERDHEIDPEDDVEEDGNTDMSGNLSTSKVDTSEVVADESNEKRGTKRKFDDDEAEEAGGDE